MNPGGKLKQNQTLVKYEIRRLRSTQDIEKVCWKIFRRESVCFVDIGTSDTDALVEIFKFIASDVMSTVENYGEEFGIEVIPRNNGRYIVREAAIFRPILEFTPVTNTQEDSHD